MVNTNPLKDRKILIFELTHLSLSVFFIILCFVIAGTMDALHIKGDNVKYGSSNFAWLFTQFTWWTNILITVLQTIRFSLRNKTIKSNFLQKHFFGVNWYFYWICYIFLVGLLFFIGAGYLTFTHNFHETNISHPEALLTFIDVIRIIITIFVHLINPLAYAFLFIWILRKGFLETRALNKKDFFKQTMKILFIGLIYPLIYIVFYIIFARLASDPYTITNLQNNWENWWIAIIVIGFFCATLYLVSWLVYIKNKSINRHNKKQP